MEYVPPWQQNSPTADEPEKPKSGPNAYDPQSPSSLRLVDRTENNLTPKQKSQRQLFVIAYYKTFNQTEAAIMAGYASRSAAKKGSELMREPYVRQLMEEFELAEKEDALLTRNRVILGLLKEAHFYGIGASHGARVGAWSKLGNYTGMEVNKAEVTLPGGVALHLTIGDKQDNDDKPADA